MHRRNLLKGAGVIALYSSFPVVVSEFLASCQSPDKLAPVFFNPAEFASLEALTDILLPRTVTPGGLDTKVPFFIDKIVNDCMASSTQQEIRKGIQGLDTSTGHTFSSLPAREMKNQLRQLDEQAFKDEKDKAWFRMVKKLALVGHFTSREGMTSALKYVKVPGDYKSCIPYKKGEQAMAKTFLMYW